MKSVGAILEKLDDRINPIAVKELRQAVQAKYVSGLLLFFLLGQLTVMGTLVLGRSTELPFSAGRQAFTILSAMLAGACLLFVPVYCASRLATERSAANVDLVFVTTLSPWSIVWGKLFSGLVIAALIFSACTPFLVFTYLLRGVDLPSIFALLFVGFLGSAAAIQIAVFVGCVPAGRPAKIALGVLVVLLGLWVFGPVAAWAVLYGAMRVGSSFRQLWVPLLVALVLALGVIGHFFVWSVALLSPRWSNRALPVRLFMSGSWLVTGIGALIWHCLDPHTPILAIWAVLGTLVSCLGLLIAVSERGAPGPRVARTIPRRGWRRALAFLFYSGATGGVALAGLMLSISLAAVLAALPGDEAPVPVLMIGIGSGVFASSLSARLLRPSLSPKSRHGHTWIIALSLGFLSLSLCLPAFGVYGYAGVNVTWAIGIGLASILRLGERIDEFRHLETTTRAAVLAHLPMPEPPLERSVFYVEGPPAPSSKPDPDGIPRSTVRLYKRSRRGRAFSFGLRSRGRSRRRRK